MYYYNFVQIEIRSLTKKSSKFTKIIHVIPDKKNIYQ